MIISLNLAGTGILVGTILSISRKEISRLVTNAVTSLTEENALEIRAWLETYMTAARTTANFMSQYQEIAVNQRRETFNVLLKTIVTANPETAAVSTCWEPDALDGQDFRYVNTPGTDGSGRFIPYWSRTQNGIRLEPLVDYEVPGGGDYYVISKRTG
ncbi:MAG: cache domain-containing protein, partial [Spirochaetaceae bacterium]|nr:cache domain-containing protein [Spirochaetaceae bacterium]